jgi:aminoglycoside phosphotransferase (APT) family kinase protein
MTRAPSRPRRRAPAAWPGLLKRLRQDGVPLGPSARAKALAGGVSSRIYRVRDRARAFVVKSALARLRVASDWRSNPGRNRHEQLYLRYVGALFPQSVPRILFASSRHGYFGMEYFGAGFTNWKAALLRGECDPRVARQAMALLARIHASSRHRPDLARRFATTRNFRQLRTDPYLRTAARRHPALAACLEREADRLERTRECLVHGDFSPKNILIGDRRLILLDCEVAWYGDPAFDVAFLLHHLCLKALRHAPRERGLAALFAAAVRAYFGGFRGTGRPMAALDRRSARLVLMLLLARVDGKSPVEYLTAPKMEFVRRFVSGLLPGFDGPLAEVRERWFAALAENFGEK